MSNETTISTIDDFSYSPIISPILLATLAEKADFLAWAREVNIVNDPGSSVKLGSITSFYGSPADRGAGVDTEMDMSEATAASNTAVSSGGVTISTAEYGVMSEVSDNTVEDTILGARVLDIVRSHHMTALQLAMADDMCAQFANLSNSIGSTGVDMTIAQLLAGKNDIRTRGGYAPDGVGYVLDNQAFQDVENGFTASSTSQAIYALAADRVLDYQPAANNGMTDGRVAAFRGDPAYATGLTDTANTAADVVSAVFVRSTQRNDDAGLTTYGQAWKRMPRFEAWRDIKKRTTVLVTSLRWGIAELLDATGSKYVTDAP